MLRIDTPDGPKFFHGAVGIRFEDGSLLVSYKNSEIPPVAFKQDEWTTIEHEEDK